MTSNNNFGASTAATSASSTETGAQTVQIKLDENGCCAACHQSLPQTHSAGSNSLTGMRDSMVEGIPQLGGEPYPHSSAHDNYQLQNGELN